MLIAQPHMMARPGLIPTWSRAKHRQLSVALQPKYEGNRMKAAAEARAFAAIQEKFLKLPLHIAVDTSFLYDHKRSRDEAAPDWDGKQGLKGWEKYQLNNVENLPALGRGFQFIQEMLSINQFALDPMVSPLVKISVVSRHPYKVAERMMHAFEKDFGDHFDEGVRRFSYGQNQPHLPKQPGGPIPNLMVHEPHIFLSASEYWAVVATMHGINSVYVPDHNLDMSRDGLPMKWGFDIDGYSITDASERIFQSTDDWRENLRLFNNHEVENLNILPSWGPGMPSFLGAYALASAFKHLPKHERPFQMGMYTARGPSAQRRIKKMLGHWKKDELAAAEQMSGENKGPFMAAQGVSILFDDGDSHVHKALGAGVLGGHKIDGVKNEDKIREILERGF